MPDSNKVTLQDHLRYRFENTLSRGPIAIIGWLALMSCIIVLLAAALLSLSGIGDGPTGKLNFIEAGWRSLMHTIDTGNLSANDGWSLRLLMLFVTLGGIFIVSMLIGTITSGLESRLTELRKGRSRVIENNHTLILGWSSKVFSIIGELIIANENQKRPRIVILADRDKVAMEDEIRSKFPDTKNTRVICRSGDPLDLDDLAVVNPHAARSIVVLAPEIDKPDIHVIKSVLAITNNPNRRKSAYHIVAEIRDEKNLEAAELVGGSEAVFVQGDDLIARVTAQTCRQSGLSVVYTELLDFDGAEIYFAEADALLGKNYRYALSAYEDSALVGLMRANGDVLINPPMTTVFEQGDQIIAISEDDDTLVLSDKKASDPDFSVIVRGAVQEAQPERTLILGFNEKTLTVIQELDNYVAPGSEVIVICRKDGASDALKALSTRLKRQRLRAADGDITSRSMLAAVKAPEFNHIIVMSYTHLPIQEADSQTLICLLHLRNIAEAAGKDLNIVSEMMDLRNRELAQVARADDFIVSDKLVSLMLSQLSENKQLEKVFSQLFSADGSEVYIRPISNYIRVGTAVDFHTLIEAAAQRGETAIGYRQIAYSKDSKQGFGVKINPNKSEKVIFAADDRIIVLAED